ncbi:hypothetical protein OG21DRAFT_1510362 [Imleria badia]|nr:hypothetical protein OG21DRAFT_1510362 [Imleria badia]
MAKAWLMLQKFSIMNPVPSQRMARCATLRSLFALQVPSSVLIWTPARSTAQYIYISSKPENEKKSGPLRRSQFIHVSTVGRCRQRSRKKCGEARLK